MNLNVSNKDEMVSLLESMLNKDNESEINSKIFNFENASESEFKSSLQTIKKGDI